MKSLAENGIIRFISITKKKNGLFANFRIKGLRGGAAYSSSIAVDLAVVDVDPSDTLEKIIEESARVAEREIKKSEHKFEGLEAI